MGLTETGWLGGVGRDLRYGLRVLRKSPVFATVAVVSLALGIGANTAIFTLVDAVLLRTLPVRNPKQLVILRWGGAKRLQLSSSYSSGGGDGHGGFTLNTFSWRVLTQMRAHSRSLDSVFGFAPLPGANVVANGQPLNTGGMLVTGNYFAGLGADTLLGRPITADNETANGLPAAVISYPFWERVFALDPGVIGRTISINGQPCTVIGVTPKSFFGVSDGGLIATRQIDITLPILAKLQIRDNFQAGAAYFEEDLFWIQAMGRMKSGRPETAAAELTGILSPNLPLPVPPETQPRMIVEPGSRGLEFTRDRYRTPLLILLTVVGLTLLMACANLAGLLLARAAARRKEIHLRLALGAKRSRVVAQLMAEGALLAGTGALGGMAFAWWGVRALLATVSAGNQAIRQNIAPDPRALAFTAAVTVAATLLFALVPALQTTRLDLASGLKEGAGAGRRRSFGARTLLAVQVAAALLLVAGATLFTRTLANLHSVTLGFDASRLVVFDIAPGRSGYDDARGQQVYTKALERLRQVPGVLGVTMSGNRLMSGWMDNGTFRVEGAAEKASSRFNFVGPDFCRTMQIPIILGRDIEPGDMTSTRRVAVINEAAARQYFGGGSPIGKRFRWERGDRSEAEVIGVAKDARYHEVRDDPRPTIYAPYTQRPYGWPRQMSVAVRTAGDPGRALAGVRRAVGEVDRMLPLIDLKTMDTQIDDMLAQERLFAWLVSLFGAVTLVLACVGLYGMAAASVASRTREIGVRMALGAGRGAVLRMVVRGVVVTAAVGLAAGLPATWALTRVVESQLYGVKAHDPASLVLAVAAVAAVCLCAVLVPARRATRVDPVTALRYE
ncbi:MAG TPA: ABC transporter permease [Bryobacteraceae bacterium]|nr:ABC transporter permease [Bryobacteraceae bacterium]